MNKKIISLSLAFICIAQPFAIFADAHFHLMDREKLIVAAKQLEEKTKEQEKRILFLARFAAGLEQNQQTPLSNLCNQLKGAGYTALGVCTLVGFLYLKKKLTRRR